MSLVQYPGGRNLYISPCVHVGFLLVTQFSITAQRHASEGTEHMELSRVVFEPIHISFVEFSKVYKTINKTISSLLMHNFHYVLH